MSNKALKSKQTMELLHQLINSFEISDDVELKNSTETKTISPNYNARRASSSRSKNFKRKNVSSYRATHHTSDKAYELDTFLSATTPMSSDDESFTQVSRHSRTRPRRLGRSAETCSSVEDKFFKDFSQSYIDFTYENPTVYHVVDYVSGLLEEHGFEYLSEKQPWGKLEAGLYYTTRNHTSLSAFAIGDSWKPEYGVGLIGAHIDALTARLKPSSLKTDSEGFELLGVAPYAGALSELWWDRDLHIGGNVLIRDRKTGKVHSQLIQSEHPIARIPSLAPHFGVKFCDYLNKETRAVPVIAFNAGEEDHKKLTPSEQKSPLAGTHSITLLRFIADLADVEVEDLVQLDLELYDGQKGNIGGIKKDFLFAPRIDDRICGFTAIHGLLATLKENKGKAPSDAFQLVTLYDNEEIGSLSKQGAQGGLSESAIERVIDSYITDKQGYSLESLYKVTYANTIILSADVNHAFNPNFGEFYLEHHKPLFNTGMTIAYDERAMATDVVGRAIIEEVARKNGDVIQKVHIRNDSRSGGTIGPHISSKTGARTIDLGIAQWSMHSIRAAVGSKDVGLGVKFFTGFFKYWRQVTDDFEDL